MRNGLLVALAASAFLLVGSSVAGAQDDDAPTGGGFGCKSHGNCEGTMYKDPSSLNSWWYGICSGCHTVADRAPAATGRSLNPQQARFVGNAGQFWRVHDQARADAVLIAMMRSGSLKSGRALAPEFEQLMRR